jgi:exopolyphosphatase/guanosine-5'-triphosphate,3'-diphosphate pyrophosphatase
MMEAMARKYAVEHRYAKQVAQFSAELFDALEPLHRLSPEMGRLLQSAAWLHDVGHFVSGTGHHKHSAYIVANSYMPGYTDQERLLVALLCRYHRKSLPAPRHDPFQRLRPDEQRAVAMMTPLLRLAVGLDTSREQKVRSIRPQIANGGVRLLIEGQADFDLELWAAERAADSFRQMYNVPLTVEKVQS